MKRLQRPGKAYELLQWWPQLGEQTWGHLLTLLTLCLGHLDVSVSELQEGISQAFSLIDSLIHEDPVLFYVS